MSDFDKLPSRDVILAALCNYFWVPTEYVESVLDLSRSQCMRIFLFARTAEWWSICGKTPDERKRNGQCITTYYGIRGIKDLPGEPKYFDSSMIINGLDRS